VHISKVEKVGSMAQRKVRAAPLISRRKAGKY